MVGETISHYRVQQHLGRGGLGEVYLAEDLRLRRPVALKLLRPDVRGDVAGQERLLAEARAASALNHPAIAVIYEVDEVQRDGAPLAFIAMEYVPGRTLAETVRDGRLSVDRVLAVGLQMAEALEAAHARGVIHRDVKPANVVLSESGRVKVLDFGLAARVLPGETDLTWTRDPLRSSDAAGLAGTLAYMAPEQALGRTVDPRADVFSLGALLYELAAGSPPFSGTNAAQLLDSVLHADPAPLPLVGDARLSDLDVLLRRMLAKDPSGRPPDMRAVREDLERLRRGESPRAVADTPSVAVLTFANITRNTEDDWLGTGIAETLTSDLRGVPGLALVPRGRIHETLRRLGAETPAPDDVLALRVGREVGARWVLAGGFQRAGDAVRVTARLLDVETGALTHSVKADGRLAEIFDLQDRLVREVSAGLRVTAPPSSVHTPEETQVVEAYEAFSKGVLNYRRETYESLDRATFLFERAVVLDPAYARAHVELGSAYASKADYLGIPLLHQRALACFRHALELQPRLVRAWRELGGVLITTGRQEEGVAAIERALELDPEDAGALAAMGRAFFIGLGEFQQAVGWYERALARSPSAGWYWLQLAHCATLARTFPRAEAAAGRAIELQKQFLSGEEAVLIVGAHMRMGHLRALQGRHAEAVEQIEHELSFIRRVGHALGGRIQIELNMRLGHAYQKLGRAAEASAVFESALAAFDERLSLGADDPHTRYYVAGLHALRGETEEALVNLEKATQLRRALTIARARIEPEFDGLRGEHRFHSLVAA